HNVIEMCENVDNLCQKQGTCERQYMRMLQSLNIKATHRTEEDAGIEN
ncbi:5197_t:CDS:1, partial [Paraglomus brasilianum]